MSDQTYAGKVKSYDPDSRIVTFRSGAQIKLPRRRSDIEAGQQWSFRVTARNAGSLGHAPVPGTLVDQIQDEPTPRRSKARREGVNTRDRS